MDNQVDPGVQRWYLIENERQARCVSKNGRKGCGEIHPFMSHGCRPVAFSNPGEWEFFSKKSVRTATGIDTDFLVSRLGPVVEINAAQAAELNVLGDPPANILVKARSLPGSATRRYPNGG